MKKTVGRARINGVPTDEISEGSTENSEKRNGVSIDRRGLENRNISSIKTYINFFYDAEIDNDKLIFEVDGELILCLLM